jgi:hypothetical protein
VKDDAGNTDTCEQTVTVRIKLACPQGLAEVTKGTCEVKVKVAPPAPAWVCPGVTVEGVRDDGKLPADPYPVGTTVIT